MSASTRLTNEALAGELVRLAQRVRRLPPPSRRRPDGFVEEKDEVAAALEALARRHCPSAVPHSRDRRRAQRGRPEPARIITIGSRRILVQARRASFALG